MPARGRRSVGARAVFGGSALFNLRNIRIFRDYWGMTGVNPPSHPVNSLLSFTARNVRSYRDEVNLSLLGTRLSAAGVARELGVAGNRLPVSVLPVAGVFGANASGKSTLLLAMSDMRRTVLDSFRRGDEEPMLPRSPFLLRSNGAERSSSFSVDLVLGGVRWQYGFEINDHQVLDEYAYHYPQGRQARVFHRNGDDSTPNFGPAFRSSGRMLAQFAWENALLLSVAGALAGGTHPDRQGVVAVIAPLFRWFRRNFSLMESRNRRVRIAYAARRLETPEVRAGIIKLLQAADLGITEIERLPLDPETAERLERAVRILAGLDAEPRAGQEMPIPPNDLVRLHHAGAEGPFPIDPGHESQGTLAWVSMMAPLFDALRTGSVLLVDELDNSLHPHLVRQFIRLFQNPRTNPRCAQLVFNAHDPTILGDSSQRALGRDQIWFTEKNEDGATTLYSMADFHPKGDEALGRRYLQGRYGAVPMLNPAAFERATDSAAS